ncbi:MAG: alpha-N-acetylglucosaminidase C-terminal domain-containing protein, partial [Clostridia bacterium]|nr:alpha-N-acetylglucosaminidase C-terminal domain-containing protein [Clostridia bacterium]
MESIRKLIERNTPEIAECFTLEKIEKENGADKCEFFSRGGKIVLRANDNVGLAHAYWCYLKKYCKAYFSHCSSFSVEIENSAAPLPDEAFKKIITQKKRVYLDYITYSNSMWTWEWDKWEKELDFMAMMGVNLALNVVGNDAVLFNALVNSGLSPRSAGYFVSGPAFFAWQMTGKIDSHLPRNDYENYEKQLQLAKKIHDRMLELGIEPVLSTFNGQISEKIIKLFGKVKNYRNEQWSAFPSTKKIDILDERFKKLMREYMFFQEEKIGKANYYMCDYFCNFDHKTDKHKYIAPLAEEFGKILNFCVESKTPCVVFPSEGYNKIFLSELKGCDKLVLDLDGTMAAYTNFFDGNDYIIGNSHNNSPHQSLRGDIRSLAKNEFATAAKEHENVAGVGFFPESIEQNPMYHELMFEMMTQNNEIDIDSWVKDYIQRRYKTSSPSVVEAYKLLVDTCYSEKNSATDIGSTFCARPVADLRHTAPFDTIKVGYDNKLLLKAVKLLLKDEIKNYNMCYCLVFTTITLLDNYAYSLYEKIMKSYYARDRQNFEKHIEEFLKLLEDADNILTTFDRTNAKFVFDELLSISANDEEEKSNSLNYLSSHTIWGPLTLECRRYDCNWIYLSEFF